MLIQLSADKKKDHTLANHQSKPSKGTKCIKMFPKQCFNTIALLSLRRSKWHKTHVIVNRNMLLFKKKNSLFNQFLI